jgi:hypothetical protein
MVRQREVVRVTAVSIHLLYLGSFEGIVFIMTLNTVH